jgi:flagellar assembly factor FliW
MKVLTKAFGTIEITERQKVVFPSGLFGFEDYHDYALLDAEKPPFYWLQSLDSVKTAFVLMSPFVFRPDYEINADDNVLKEIGLEKAQNALVFAVLTIPREGPMTANLQGPLVINRASRLGAQIILSDPRWKTRHNVAEELFRAKTEAMQC